jgi:hypothetical protein
MLRKDQEITETSAIEAVIRSSVVCRLALSDKDQPYIVPLCFGYEDNTLYFHSGVKGRKLEILRKNPSVCFEFEVNVGVLKAEEACSWNMAYQSVIGFGKAVFLEDMPEKQKALGIIVGQYSDKKLQLPNAKLRKTVVIKVPIDSMTVKKSSSD